MPNSDIILEDNQVKIIGDIVSEGRFLELSSPIRVKGSIILNDNNGGSNITINQRGIHSETARLQIASIKTTGPGRSVINDLFVQKLISIDTHSKNLKSSEVVVGTPSDHEGSGENGKIKLIDTSGRTVLTLEAGNQPKISVQGYGDLIEKIKQLERKVEALERRI